ncbi:hypothetical protein [Gordonia sp. NPDC003376]
MANKQPRRSGYRPRVAGTRRSGDATETTGAETTGAEATGAEATGAEATGAEATGAEATGAEATGAGAVESATDVEETPTEITEVIEKSAEDSDNSTDPDSTDPDSTGSESVDHGTTDSGASESDGAESDSAESDGPEPVGLSLTKSDKDSGDIEPDASVSGDAASGDADPDEPATGRPVPTGKTRTVSRVSTIRPQARPAAPSSSRSARPAKARRTRRPSGSGPFSTRLIAILAGVAAVLAVVAVILGFHPGVSIGANRAFLDQTATTDLTAQAQTKVCTAIAADGTKVDQWAGKARAVLTGQALKEFNDYLPTQKQLLDQTKAVAECRVDAIGVRDLTGNGDGATAVVLANLVVSESVNGQATNSGTPRTQLHMVKQGDQWLISQVEAV